MHHRCTTEAMNEKDIHVRLKKSAAVVLTCCLLLCAASVSNRKDCSRSRLRNSRLAKLPRTMIWAWERPEHLEFIDPHTTGVAFLAAVIHLHKDQTIINNRQQTMTMPDNTPVIGVVRIESSGGATLDQHQRSKIVDAVGAVLRRYKLSGIQIDFDARVSERDFYRKLMTQLRESIPVEKGLSMTALASWCLSDYWISDFPVDEIVPMFFSMGIDQRNVLYQLKKGRSLASAVCEASKGIMVDGIVLREAAGDRRLRSRFGRSRLYLFSPRSWCQKDFNKTVADIYAWR